MSVPGSSANASAVLISASANRHSHAADVSPGSLVAFGSNRFVGLWDASVRLEHSAQRKRLLILILLQRVDLEGVTATLPCHEGEVTCTAFSGGSVLYSADNKGKIICRGLEEATVRLIRPASRFHMIDCPVMAEFAVENNIAD